MKKVLMIGGTGTISSPITQKLSADKNVELYVLNRGNKSLPEGTHQIIGDMQKDMEGVKETLKEESFDVVINFIIYSMEDAKRNYELFRNKTKQFIFISTVVTLDNRRTAKVNEENERGNAFSLYGQSKAAIEEFFLSKKEEEGFPVTIVRPTQTYSDDRIPLSLKGKTYWSVCSRMLRGKEVIVHGDGQGIWAMTHASDFAKFFVKLVGNEKSIGEIYQIMNPESFSWDEIYYELAKQLGGEYKPVYISTYLLDASKAYNWRESIHGDKHFSKVFDISKIREIAPEEEFSVDMKTGVKMYVDYMNAHPEKKLEDEAFDAWCDATIEQYKKACEIFKGEIK